MRKMGESLYFGGSFNPPHLAHIACAEAAAVAARMDSVVLVPNGSPALKNQAEIAPAVDRLAMTRLAAADANGRVQFAVDDLEIHRTGTSFTIDTVKSLMNKGVTPVNWLIGADQLLNLHRWHRFDELLGITTFWVMARPGYVIDWTALDPAVQTLRDRVVAVPQFNVSATEIRRRLRAGESVDGLVSPAVRDYLASHRLYLAKP